MANDRLLIKCDRCGGTVIFAKHFMGEWRTTTLGAIDDFFEWHYLKCDNNTGEYSFVTEMGGDAR